MMDVFDDITMVKSDIDLKLTRETNNLAMLRETLDKSASNTESMLSILSSFEGRLQTLNDTIVPVYQETENLRRRQQNIEKTMGELDKVLGHYHVANEIENVVKEGPSRTGLQEYLSYMDRVIKAKKYFTDTNPGCPELSSVSLLFDDGKDNLQLEFKSLLGRHGKPVQPITVLNMIGTEELQSKRTVVEHLPPKIVTELGEIARWLVVHGNSTDFTVYMQSRSSILVKSLQGLKEHLKSSSGGSLSGAGMSLDSPMLGNKMRRISVDTPTRKSIKRIQNPFLKHTPTKTPKATLKATFDSGSKRPVPMLDSEEVTQIDITDYITEVTGLLRLIQSEYELLCTIIPQNHQRPVFDHIVQAALDTIVNEGEQIAQNAKKAISEHEYTAVLSVFPVIRHLRNIRREFDLALEGCQAPTRAKLASLVATLNSTGAKALEEFIENIRHDPDKASNMPRDGTVHELTNHTIIFLEQLLEYIDTAGLMILMHIDPSSASTNLDTDKAKLKLADYITRVLSALGLNLSTKSDSYSDITLRTIFMLNNYNYILKSLSRTGLLDLIVLWNKDVATIYNNQILEQKRLYSQSWSKVLHFILEVNKPMSVQRVNNPETTKLKDKERQNIKDKFSGFNKELDEIHRIQKGYAIPDPELRESLKGDNKEFIISKYEMFREKYIAMNFTKNPDKYIKYTVDNVNSKLDKFFDSTA